ncbi:hypothetical protein B4N89_45525 [Embleya scabrispora]|uniref:Asparagine synthetase domain-containing protein n=1 Tax=Embleya scabrispora TaxID=159449 RepID=A0A1T3NIS4_9ACTN|nr:asparagine synthase-related protein [Embleya scabrispora]OPC76747.1 hypothetical protein B4N89_45525 [Embleya scabrispora]
MRSAAWLCALPDDPAAGRHAHALTRGGASRGRIVAAHRSGRPWIVACGAPHSLLLWERPDARVVVVGRTGADVAALGRVVCAGGAGAGLAGRVMTGLDGSFHTFVSTADGVQACGDVVGLCPVFHARVDGLSLWGDCPGVLADLAGRTDPDRVYLAARLFGWAPPSVHVHRSPYAHVGMVAPGCAIVQAPGGAERVERVWAPPDDDVPLREAAAGCRDALVRAVSTCAAAGHRTVFECSGGLDSSTLALLGRHLGVAAAVLTRLPARDGGEDARHARALSSRLAPVPHVWIDQGLETPAAFDGIDTPLPGGEPGFALSTPDLQRYVFRRAREHGDVLVSGHGADEILTPPHNHLPDTATRRPLAALAHLRGYAALEGVPTSRAAWRAAHSRVPYAVWLDRWRASLTAETPGAPTLWGWEPELLAPPWITREARALLADAVDTAAPPLHPRRHQHHTHAALLWAAGENRALAHAGRHTGLYTALPFLDRPVVEAFAAVRADERRTPHAWKQALTTAFADLLPEGLRRRRTKSTYSLKPDLDAARERVLAALTDPITAELGLVAAEHAHAALTAVDADPTNMPCLTRLLGVELWLRADTAPTPHAPPQAPRPAAKTHPPAPHRTRARPGVRLAPGVLLVREQHADHTGALTHHGRTVALGNASAVIVATALRDGKDPAVALHARFPDTPVAALDDAVTAVVDHLGALGMTVPDA